METTNTAKGLPDTILKEITKLGNALAEIDSLIGKEDEFIQRQERIAKINALKSRMLKEIERGQSEEVESEHNSNTAKVFSSVTAFALGGIMGALTKSENPFILRVKSLRTELARKADFGRVLIAIRESGKLEDIEVIAVSRLARGSNITESDILHNFKGKGVSLKPEEFWKLLRRLEEEIMNGKYKSETQQNKALLNYAKEGK